MRMNKFIYILVILQSHPAVIWSQGVFGASHTETVEFTIQYLDSLYSSSDIDTTMYIGQSDEYLLTVRRFGDTITYALSANESIIYYLNKYSNRVTLEYSNTSYILNWDPKKRFFSSFEYMDSSDTCIVEFDSNLSLRKIAFESKGNKNAHLMNFSYSHLLSRSKKILPLKFLFGIE